VNRGYLDDIDVKRALSFESALQSFMKTKHADLMNKIESSKDLDADGEKQLAAGIEEFRKSWA
jgi:F-type H+-transporting ATPase subunit alpha